MAGGADTATWGGSTRNRNPISVSFRRFVLPTLTTQWVAFCPAAVKGMRAVGPSAVAATLVVVVLFTQVGAEVEAPAAAGRLYLTSTLLRTGTAADCPAPTYALNMTNGSLAKAYVGRSLVATACPATFEFNLTEPTTVSGNVTAHVVLGCDSTTIWRSVPGTLATMRVDLMRNASPGPSASGYAASMVCGAGSRVPFDLTIPNKSLTFKAGDKVGLRVNVWAFTGDQALARNVHVVVGGPNSSVMEAVGLPSDAAPDPGASPDPNATTTAPGGSGAGTTSSATSSPNAPQSHAQSGSTTTETVTTTVTASPTNTTETNQTTPTSRRTRTAGPCTWETTATTSGTPNATTSTPTTATTTSATGPTTNASTTGPTTNATASNSTTTSLRATPCRVPSSPETTNTTANSTLAANETHEPTSTSPPEAGRPAEASRAPLRSGGAQSPGPLVAYALAAAACGLALVRRKK